MSENLGTLRYLPLLPVNPATLRYGSHEAAISARLGVPDLGSDSDLLWRGPLLLLGVGEGGPGLSLSYPLSSVRKVPSLVERGVTFFPRPIMA